MTAPAAAAAHQLRVAKRLLQTGSTLAAARQLRALISDESIGRDGLQVMSDGLDVTNYRRNPIVLFSHIDTRPIARATVSRAGNAWYATLQFPDAGVSADADQVLRLAQANILSGISIGFNPLETKPLNGAMRIVRSELLEISVCAVPALQSALVTERSQRAIDDRSTAAGRRLLAWSRRAAMPLVVPPTTAEDRRRRLARALRRKLIAQRWLQL
jgi:HK97 family phage prohead protease